MATQTGPATRPSTLNMDLGASLERATAQFRGLNMKEPGQWPAAPKVVAMLLVVGLAVLAGWLALLSSADDELTAERGKEPALRTEFRSKLGQAINLTELRKQKQQVQEYVTQLEKQLPGKAEMDALLSDINQAGLGRGLQFELFRPGNFEVKEYYVELPIAIKVSGRYHDIGAFAADVANLSRIVTLHNLSIVGSAKDPNAALAMDATARTYRYLDAAEVAERRKAEQAAKAKAAAGAKK